MPKVVLLVEDDDEFRGALGDLLGEEGYVVHARRNGSEGLVYLSDRASAPDVVVVDLMMPVLDGWEFIRRVRANPALATVPLVVVSAVSDEVTGDTHGVTVIKKPVDLHQLLTTLERVARRAP